MLAVCVGVRSDYFCGVWRFSERDEPRLMQVINTKEAATCINVRLVTIRKLLSFLCSVMKGVQVRYSLVCVVSPHVLGEVLVASESGAANLWTVGKG